MVLWSSLYLQGLTFYHRIIYLVKQHILMQEEKKIKANIFLASNYIVSKKGLGKEVL